MGFELGDGAWEMRDFSLLRLRAGVGELGVLI
jgi:hypothetical protein